jgi:ABC-2 type transport system permease protein
MAVVNETGANMTNEAGRELTIAARLGAEARAQYAALGALRWHMFINGLRSSQGVFELGARTIGFLVYGSLGLGLGFGLGVTAYAIAHHRSWQFLPILFWIACILWQAVPIMLASFHEQFDMSTLLRFPVRFGPFYLLYLIFGLADISTLLGVLCCAGILTGITAARPDLIGWAVLGLAGFAAFNILLVRAIFAWIDRWLAQRKTREILGAIFLVLALSAQLLNPALYQKKHVGPVDRAQRAENLRRMRAEYGPWLRTANHVQVWLPPGLAAASLGQAGEQRPAPALGSLGMLGIYVLAAGGVLAVRLRAEYRGESLGQAPSRKKAERRAGAWLLDGSGPIAAVMEKEVRTLMRSLSLLYALGTPLLFVFFFGVMFRNATPRGGHPFVLALPLSVSYALLGFTQLIYNNLGAEGAGIQILFLSPTPIRTVLIAKNFFHSLMFGVDAVLAGILVSLRLGYPDPEVLAATLGWLLFALPAQLAVGNVFSLLMPHRVNPGRISRQRGSQANALLSLLVQVVVLGVGIGVFGLCSLFGRLWLAVPVFLVLGGASVYAWMRVLRNADGMANRRRDSLVATLMKES